MWESERMHNVYMFVLHTAGLPAATLLLTIVIAMLIRLVRAVRAGAGPPVVAALLSLLALALAMNIIAIVFLDTSSWVAICCAAAGSWTLPAPRAAA